LPSDGDRPSNIVVVLRQLARFRDRRRLAMHTVRGVATWRLSPSRYPSQVSIVQIPSTDAGVALSWEYDRVGRVGTVDRGTEGGNRRFDPGPGHLRIPPTKIVGGCWSLSGLSPSRIGR